MTKQVFIGIDLGGTRIRAARYTADLALEQRTETKTLAKEGQDAVIRRMIQEAQSVWPSDGAHVAGIGISAPGPVNPSRGVVVHPPNLKGWHDVPLVEIFQGQLGVPTYLGNDANVAALAEATMGAGRGYRDVLFFTISTGIGGGVISDGKLLIGSEGLGAECGHIIMVVDDEIHDWEYQAAGPGIARQAREAIQKGEKSVMLERAGGSIEAINGQIVGESANAGDPLAVKLIERAGKMIGLGIVSFLHTFNPQIVVLGGSVAEGTWDIMNKPMWDAIKKYSMDHAYWEKLMITKAELGENVSLIGAAALAMKKGG